ncbi:MAG: hypothetical protein Q9226_005344 [Calogaya cf. arnoldii]
MKRRSEKTFGKSPELERAAEQQKFKRDNKKKNPSGDPATSDNSEDFNTLFLPSGKRRANLTTPVVVNRATKRSRTIVSTRDESEVPNTSVTATTSRSKFATSSKSKPNPKSSKPSTVKNGKKANGKPRCPGAGRPCGSKATAINGRNDHALDSSSDTRSICNDAVAATDDSAQQQHPYQRLKPVEKQSDWNKSKKKVKDKLIVAIDFGTTRSGAGWAQTELPDDQHIIKQWPESEEHGVEGLSSEKVPTEIQYGPDGAINWGNRIRHDAQRHQWFKLELDPEKPQPLVNLATDYPDEKAAPPGYNQAPEKLVSDYLTALREHVEGVLQSSLERSIIATTPIEYIITVPAVWSDAAKNKTRDCAELAGMGSADDLKIISEPEAAAIYALQKMPKSSLDLGDVFVVCDAGGGTVDLVSYKITKLKPLLRVVKVAPGQGGICGSTFLDRRCKALLRQKLGSHTAWSEEILEDAVRGFEKLKGQFTGDKNSVLRVPVPGLPENSALGIRRAKYNIQGSHVYDIYEPVIRNVLALVEQQIAATEKVDASVKAVLLVGGFGQGKYLHQRLVKEVAPQGIEVLQPPNGYRSDANNRWEVNVYHWFIMKKDSISERKAQREPYHVEQPVSEDGLEPLRITIVKCIDEEDEGPPVLVGDGSVTTVAEINVPLSRIPVEKLSIREADDGERYYIIDFGLKITCFSAETTYELMHNTKSYGRVTAEFV